MSDEISELLKHSETVLYKSKSGELKVLHVVMPLDPSQKKLTYADLQILARQISNILKEDA